MQLNPTSQATIRAWHDFESRDPRRVMLVLVTIDQMGQKATAHYVAAAIGAQRVDVIRAIKTLQNTFLVTFTKSGSHYQIMDWGLIDPISAKNSVNLRRDSSEI